MQKTGKNKFLFGFYIRVSKPFNISKVSLKINNLE